MARRAHPTDGFGLTGSCTIGDHPSDLELTIRGKSLAELFSAAARAAAEIIAPGLVSGRAVTREIVLSAPSREDLFVAWLNEIVYLVQVERVLPRTFHFALLSPFRLLAAARCVRVPPSAFPGGAEIKAATYHGLSLRRAEGGWEAHVILDL